MKLLGLRGIKYAFKWALSGSCHGVKKQDFGGVLGVFYDRSAGLVRWPGKR